ncbi:MAG: hypothetical protein HKN92_08510 [Chitinophagales bacterium]|nr:hypothetical protein [Chitinophagales bacterium]
MAFDSEKLRPLYRLEIGKPGSSYAFVVAKKTGLDQEMIDRAKSKVEQKHFRLEQLLTKLEDEKSKLRKSERELEKREIELEKMLSETEELKISLEKLTSSVQQKIKSIEKDAANRFEKNINKLINELSKTKDPASVLAKHKVKAQKKREQLESGTAKERLAKQLEHLKGLKRGVKVRLKDGHSVGQVEEVKNGKAKVIFGDFQTFCNLSDLEIVTEKKKKKKKKSTSPPPPKKK